MRDPHQYFQRLHRLIEDDAQAVRRHPGFTSIIEKILADGERMPRFAGVAGTTGYEWLNLISRVLIEERGLSVLDASLARGER